MEIWFGNPAPHSTSHEKVDPAIGRDALVEQAAQAGVSIYLTNDPEDGEADDEMLAARLSSVPVHTSLGEQGTTYYGIPDSYSLMEHVRIVEADWSYHSRQTPVWVEASDDVLATVLAAQFDCPVGRPEDWEDK